MSSINSESVYFLISDLCKRIQQEINPHKAPKKSSGRKLKSLCYEILLKKSLKFTVNTETVCNPLRDLDAQLFELRIRNGYNNDERICEDFERFIQYFSEEAYFEEDVGKNILTFLLNLQGSVEEENFVYKDEDLKKSTLLVPGPFTLHANYSKNLYYPKKRVQISKSSYEHFEPLKPLQDYENPYLPRLLFQGDSNKLIKIDQKFGISSQREVTIFSGFVRDTWGSALNLNPFACKFFTNISKVTTCLNVQPAYERKQKYGNKALKSITPNVNDIPDENKTFSWNWEHLGTNQLTIDKRFCSETSSALHLDKLVVENSGGTYIAKQVQLKQFIADLKALVIGIQSDIFKHDEYIIFHMLPDITIPGVTPAVIESFVSDFLVCGTCYKRLQVMISKRNYKLMFDGFIFKTLCNAVGEYLMIFRNFVISFECNSLSELHCKMRNMMKQIVALSHTLAIHMDVDVSVKPPMGSPQFLGYLYREITQVTQNDIVMLLVYILKRCCHVYFKHLQKWIFYGVLDDPCNELFICFIDHYRPYTKYFFDKAYFVRRESVPGFFQGYEDQILQCGKYAMLLKAFKPNHPLFDIEYPSISVCLSFEEVQGIADNCKKYAERAREVCGKPITPSDIFYKRLEKKREFFKIVSEKSKKNMDKWEAEQKTRASLRVAEKKKRLEEIHIQLQESKERKLAEKKANIEFELKLLKESDELENKRLIHEQLEIQKRVEYYQELNDIIEERKQRIDKECVIAKSSNDGLLLGTPVSSGTDFESCWGEDPESGYEDCVSNEFLEKFQQNEDELVKIVTSEHDEKENVYNLDTREDNDNNTKTIKKSASDYFNSNEIAPPDSNVISELQQNRTKILGSNIAYCFDNTQSNKVKVNKSLTEAAEKIKCKVLMQEFGYDISNNMNETADIINSNLQTKDDNSQQKHMISDLQKNRQKMMHDDIFAEFNNDQADTKTLKLDLNSELAKNRRRVLESEFHILTGENNSAETTPMSTTSDSCLFDEKIDENINCNKTSANLRVCIDTVKYLDVEKMQLDIPTAVIEETTPECALNTAGIKARNGFDFRIEGNKTDIIKSKATANSIDFEVDELQIELNDNIPNKLARDNLSPYKRCEELVKSNFKCRPLSPYFSLNKRQQDSNSEHVQMLQERKKQLNCLSAITLTEFLQKSVTIPLSTHMEIMNSEIMRIFLDDLDIIGHFKSLRNYFFLMDGEFGSFICDGLITKLEKGATPTELLNYQMLHTILDNALGSSIMGSDKNSDNLSFIVTELPDKFDLYSSSVLDNLSLSYRIAWPVNLILNPETLDQYANIFKYLMKVRRISWLLEESYHMLKEVVKKNGNGILQSPQYRHVQQIRHKFFHFVHALRNHITSSALQASWKTFKDDLISAKTIEDLYRKHTTYIKRVLFLCMLNRRSVEFFNTIENIFKVSLRFYRNLKSREWKKLPDNEHFTHSRYEKLLNDELEFEKLIKYTIYLGNKIVRHGYQEEIGEFINLINYNYYYVVDV